MSHTPTIEQGRPTRAVAGTIGPLDRLTVGPVTVEYCGGGTFVIALPGERHVQLKVLDKRRATFAVECPPDVPVELVKSAAEALSTQRRKSEIENRKSEPLVILGPGGDYVREIRPEDLQ